MRCRLLAVIVIAVMVTTIFMETPCISMGKAVSLPDVYVGIDAAYDNLNEIKQLIDNVSGYTNLFVVGCRAFTHNETILEDTCQYLYDHELSFIIYQEDALGRRPLNNTVSNWTQTAKTRWGNNFLGFYYMDELGGKQLDQSFWTSIESADSLEDMTNKYVSRVQFYVDWFRSGYSDWRGLSLFTSDYGLYWYDYQGGYDTVFAEYGWNSSRQLNTALCRGAATAQDKAWGAIITWTYKAPPYLENGTELFNDMLYAYNNGAKYIIVFDANEDWTQGILTTQHLDALKQFWSYVKENPRPNNNANSRSTVILPYSYGYGLRGPEDKIWGLWPADNVSYSLCVGINFMLQQYGDNLDIIYDSGLSKDSLGKYQNVIYWNDSSKFPDVMPISASFSEYSLAFLLVRYFLVLLLGVVLVAVAVVAIVLLVVKKTTGRRLI
jgi:hypothetical protein